MKQTIRSAVLLAVSSLGPLLIAVLPLRAQVHPWTDRANLGFKGPVRSVQTTITNVNADSRPGILHKLQVQGHSDWALFDEAARRIEFVSASTGNQILSISKCRFDADGAKVCEETKGNRHKSREQQTTLPDGSREVEYLLDSKLESREMTHFDKEGRTASVKAYGKSGNLTSEESTSMAGHRWKIYSAGGLELSDILTRESDEQNRIERWFYDSDGALVWYLAISSSGDLLYHSYDLGFKQKLSSSGSLGTCQPQLCVSYTFDPEGSGRLEKTVKYVQEANYLEPESEEHYDFDGVLDEKAEIKYTRDKYGNWTSRSVYIWDFSSNVPVEIEQDTRAIQYYE